MASTITERAVDLGGDTVGILESGPQDGPLAVCLHGFPDTARTWRHLLPALADAGFHAVAPWLRGYAPSSLSPSGSYPLALMIDDTVRLHEALGGDENAVLVGHDWGAAIAYGAAGYAPERWRKVVGLAVPPTAAFVQGLFSYEQLKRSFYIFFFQTPFADAIVAADDMAFVAGLWEDWSPGYDASEDVAHVRAALDSPERVAAAIGYYRAMFDQSATPPELAAQAAALLAPVPRPVLYLHGRNDGCFGVELVEREDIAAGIRAAMAPGSEVVSLDGCGHFLQLERPHDVNKLVLDWVSG